MKAMKKPERAFNPLFARQFYRLNQELMKLAKEILRNPAREEGQALMVAYLKTANEMIKCFVQMSGNGDILGVFYAAGARPGKKEVPVKPKRKTLFD